ncbi:MAG: pyridoxamine 5'-phosphate oxidase family protein [Anaerolineaceae bacterium]|nr:pyridoxamine 5'-phosphate oxidase family protein [Anaerolineaceae bacterium]
MPKNNPYLNDQQRIQHVLRTAYIMRIACLDAGVPYIVPLNFGYTDGKIYFHAAKTGKKMDCFNANPQVGFQMDNDVAIIPSGIPCKNSVKFQSVIGRGTVTIVDDPQEKRYGLLSLSRQLGNNSDEMDQAAIDQTAVLRLDIISCTYKQSPVKGYK